MALRARRPARPGTGGREGSVAGFSTLYETDETPHKLDVDKTMPEIHSSRNTKKIKECDET